MEKQALKVDYGTVGRFGIGGAMAGAGTAALLNLVHMLREQRKEQIARGPDSETDANTIVLNLPSKTGAFTTKVAYALKQAPMTSYNDATYSKIKPGGRKIPGDKGSGQFHNPDVIKKATGWPTLTLSSLAAMGSAGAGVALVDKLYQMRRDKQLKEELAAAQQDYVKALSGKSASAIDELFPMPGEKQADANRTFGILNYPLAAAALLTVMGTGGTSYITKKVLDEKLRESRSKGLDLPQVKRIVFRSQPSAIGSPDEEEATEQDMTNIKAAMFIMMDKLDSHTRVLGTPGVKEAQQAAGLSTGKLFNLSQGDVGTIMDVLNKHPELAKIIVRQGMAHRPIMKHFQWAADTAPGLALGKSKIRNMLAKYITPGAPQAKLAAYPVAGQQSRQQAVAEQAEGTGQLSAPMAKTPTPMAPAAPPAPVAPIPQPTAPVAPVQAVIPKVAGLVDTAAAMLVGKTLGSSGAEDVAKELLSRAPSQSPSELNETGTPKIDLSKVTVSAQDPKAEAYVKANRKMILQLLQQMADDGKI